MKAITSFFLLMALVSTPLLAGKFRIAEINGRCIIGSVVYKHVKQTFTCKNPKTDILVPDEGTTVFVVEFKSPRAKATRLRNQQGRVLIDQSEVDAEDKNGEDNQAKYKNWADFVAGKSSVTNLALKDSDFGYIEVQTGAREVPSKLIDAMPPPPPVITPAKPTESPKPKKKKVKIQIPKIRIPRL